jgi:hypothetical protein
MRRMVSRLSRSRQGRRLRQHGGRSLRRTRTRTKTTAPSTPPSSIGRIEASDGTSVLSTAALPPLFVVLPPYREGARPDAPREGRGPGAAGPPLQVAAGTRGLPGIQYHPSLLPKYRGPSSINWPIIKGETETGLTIFRPTDGLGEGAVILQKKTPMGPDDTLGSVYFDRLLRMGVEAMLEAADLVVAGRYRETAQDESQASYEGWCRTAEARLDWAKPVDHVYNLIRGCNPAPGVWTTLGGKTLQVFDARKHLFRRLAEVPGKIGGSPT